MCATVRAEGARAAITDGVSDVASKCGMPEATCKGDGKTHSSRRV
jgi:hypothetical protein